MEKNNYYICEQFTDMVLNSDFLKFKKNRDLLQKLLTIWQQKLDDQIRAEEEFTKIKPQLDAVNKIYDETFKIMFGAMSGRFSPDNPDMKEKEKWNDDHYGQVIQDLPISDAISNYLINEEITNDTNFGSLTIEEASQALRDLAKWEME